ncbi:MAG TPA: hypothetical protein VGQ21_07235, partial [Thermoanaerobaculia bacterium]|nr:hypothetical protein [Thermoanaerobaculia bacterium]
YETLGNRTLAEVIRFEAKEQVMIEEAATRLANGNDPGVVPERFLIPAARASHSTASWPGPASSRRISTPSWRGDDDEHARFHRPSRAVSRGARRRT